MSARSSLGQTIFFAVLLPAFLVALGVGAYLAMGVQEPKQAPVDGSDTVSKLQKLAVVSVAPIQSYAGIQSLDVSVSGTVVPFRQITLAAEVAGRVQMKSEKCRIGHFVSKGEVLFELDATDFELDVERLQSMRDTEYAQQRELDQEIDNANKSLMLADEEFELQSKEIKRLESLPAGFASDTELDQARRTKIASANQRLTIQNQIQLLETRRTRIKLNERLAATQLEQAKVNLERTRIKSPIDGVIITESVQEDSYVQKGASLCLIEDTKQVEVSCNLRTDQLLLVLEHDRTSGSTLGDSASRVVSGSGYELPKTPVTVSYHVAGAEDVQFEWKGVLSRYEGLGLDAQSRTVPVRVLVENPREVYRNGKRIEEQSNGGLPALVRGMFVDCKIHTTPSRDLVLVPKLALKPGNQVWKFEPDNSIVKGDEAGDNQPSGQAVSEKGATTSKNVQISIRPEEWNAGWVKVVKGIKVINLIRPIPDSDAEYWVAESRDDLKPGMQTVTSPLANLIGDGSDKVRYMRDDIQGRKE